MGNTNQLCPFQRAEKQGLTSALTVSMLALPCTNAAHTSLQTGKETQSSSLQLKVDSSSPSNDKIFLGLNFSGIPKNVQGSG